jgi:hypothetical protein
MTREVLKEILKEALQEEGYNRTWLVWMFAIIIAIQIIQALIINWKTSKINSKLKKSEFVYSEYKKLQFDAYVTIYPTLSMLRTYIGQILEIDTKTSIHSRVQSFKGFRTHYLILNNEMSKKKYALSKEVKDKYVSTINAQKKPNTVAKEHLLLLKVLEVAMEDQSSFMTYEKDVSFEDNLKKAETIESKSFINDKDFTNLDNSIKGIRDEIDKYFSKFN